MAWLRYTPVAPPPMACARGGARARVRPMHHHVKREREREGRRGWGKRRGASSGGGAPREEHDGRRGVGGSRAFFCEKGDINLFGMNWGDVARCWPRKPIPGDVARRVNLG